MIKRPKVSSFYFSVNKNCCFVFYRYFYTLELLNLNYVHVASQSNGRFKNLRNPIV